MLKSGAIDDNTKNICSNCIQTLIPYSNQSDLEADIPSSAEPDYETLDTSDIECNSEDEHVEHFLEVGEELANSIEDGVKYCFRSNDSVKQITHLKKHDIYTVCKYR